MRPFDNGVRFYTKATVEIGYKITEGGKNDGRQNPLEKGCQ